MNIFTRMTVFSYIGYRHVSSSGAIFLLTFWVEFSVKIEPLMKKKPFIEYIFISKCKFFKTDYLHSISCCLI